MRLRAAAVAVAVPAALLTCAPPAAAQEAAPPVLVAGDSLAHQAVEEIREELHEAGYDDVRFEVHGGTLIEWATERVRTADEPIVVFATGSNNAQGGWTEDDERAASDAVAALEHAACVVWVLPKAAWYPGGHELADPAASATVAGIRRAVAGTDVHDADWAEVADAVPEIHDWDGVHHTAGGATLFAELVAGAVAGTCRPVDPTVSESHRRYVGAVHRILLDREPTDPASSRWTWLLDHGHPPLAFARRLGTTPEWVDQQVAELYRLALGREPEPAGLTHWRDRVIAGEPLAAVAAHVYGSAEARELAGGTSSGLVDTLYRGLLHRQPDPAGTRYWTGRMAAGMPAPVVAAELHGSLESRRDRVRRLYRSILAREPDATGLAHWADALVTVGDLRLAATLVASDELMLRTAAAG